MAADPAGMSAALAGMAEIFLDMSANFPGMCVLPCAA
jgi:hypothetical protein